MSDLTGDAPNTAVTNRDWLDVLALAWPMALKAIILHWGMPIKLEVM